MGTAIEVILAVAGVLGVVFAWVRDREEEPPPPAVLEGGSSHLRGDESRSRRR